MLCSAQNQRLIEFMSENPELRSGKFTTTFSFKSAQKLWEKITVELNSIPNGNVKNWAKWRKTWQDLKKNAKAKNSKIRKHATQTGGGPSCPSDLTEAETKALISLMSNIQTDGMEIYETPITFDAMNESALLDVDTSNTNIDLVPSEHLQLISNANTASSVNDIENIEILKEHNYNFDYPSASSTKRQGGPPKKSSKTSNIN